MIARSKPSGNYDYKSVNWIAGLVIWLHNPSAIESFFLSSTTNIKDAMQQGLVMVLSHSIVFFAGGPFLRSFIYISFNSEMGVLQTFP